MRRRLVLAGAFKAFLFFAAPALGQRRIRFVTLAGGGGGGDTGTIVWTIPQNASAYPLGGASTVDADGAQWDRSLQTGIGPQGQNAVRIAHIGTTDTALEYYHGKWDWTGPTVAQGATVVFREIIRFNAPIAWNDDGGGRFGFKHIVIGTDGADDVNRGFINLRSDLSVPADVHEGNQVLMRIEKNVDGPPSRTDVHDLTSGVWYFIQVEYGSSSTAVATDGYIKVWVNNNTYASPTAQSSGGFAWPTVGWERISLGFYGESLGLLGNANYDIAGFVYQVGTSTPGSAFNSSFYVP